MKLNIKCHNYIGFTFALINLLIFIKFYLEALRMDAQYQLLWIPLSFIDFPLTILFFILMSIGVSPNVSALISFGILGTFWWYLLSSFIANKFCFSKKIC